MNNIRKLRERAGFRQKYIVERLQRQGSSVDEPLYSKMEADKALPCDIDRARIADMYHIAPQEVATYPEGDLQDKASKLPGDRHKSSVRVSFRPAQPALFMRALEILGLTTTEWMRRQEKAAIRAAKRKAPDEAGPLDKGAKKNIAPSEYHGKGGMSNE